MPRRIILTKRNSLRKIIITDDLQKFIERNFEEKYIGYIISNNIGEIFQHVVKNHPIIFDNLKLFINQIPKKNSDNNDKKNSDNNDKKNSDNNDKKNSDNNDKKNSDNNDKKNSDDDDKKNSDNNDKKNSDNNDKKNSDDDDNYNLYVKLFFDILFYNNYNDGDYGKIIDILVRKNVWEIVDYIHISGHKTSNIRNLLKYYPENKFTDLEYYGYDLSKELIIYKLNHHKNFDNEKLTEEIVKGMRSDLLIHSTFDQLKYLHEKKLIQFTDDDIPFMCKHLNVSGVLYTLDIGYKINKKMLNALFCIKLLPRTKRQRKIIRYRAFRRIHYRGTIISKTKYIQNDYEKNMILILNKLNANEKILKINPLVWKFLFMHNYFNLSKKLSELGLKPSVNRYAILGLINEAIYKDDPSIIKQYLEFNLIKPDTLNKKSKLLDNAILNKSDKITKFLIEELKMKCSKSILIRYLRQRSKAKIELKDLVKLLDSLNFPIKDNVLICACQYGNTKMIDYLIETKKMKVNSKHLEYILLKKDYKLVSHLIDKGAKISNKKLIDRLLNHAIKSSSFIPLVSLSLIKYVHKKYNATASNVSVNHCFRLKNWRILDFLHKEFNLTCDHVPITDIYGRRFRFFHYRYYRRNMNDDTKFILYIIDNNEKLKITITPATKVDIIRHIIARGRNNDLKSIVEKLNYKFSLEDVHTSIEHGNVLSLRIIIDQGFEITKDFILKIMNMSKTEMLKILRNDYHVDFKTFIDLKQLHIYLSSEFVRESVVKFLVDDIGIVPSPYTLECYVKGLRPGERFYRNNVDIIIYLVNKLNKKITEKFKNDITPTVKEIECTYSTKVIKKIANLLQQCEIINYDPVPDEIVEFQQRQFRDFDSASEGSDLDIQDNLDLDIQNNLDLDIQNNLDLDIQDNLDLDIQDNLDLDIQDNLYDLDNIDNADDIINVENNNNIENNINNEL